jgi:hypothetical protein
LIQTVKLRRSSPDVDACAVDIRRDNPSELDVIPGSHHCRAFVATHWPTRTSACAGNVAVRPVEANATMTISAAMVNRDSRLGTNPHDTASPIGL